MPNKKSGFTIVELLIVIVVIGILAAITIVAYNGIQNRGNDATVQTDLRNITQQLSVYNADNSSYPLIGALPGLGLKVTKTAYLTANNAMLYCAAGDGSSFAIIAKSKSGTTYYSSNSSGGIKVASFAFPTGMAYDCPSAGSSSASGGWIHDLSSGWRSWV